MKGVDYARLYYSISRATCPNSYTMGRSHGLVRGGHTRVDRESVAEQFYLHPGVTFVVQHVHNPCGGKGGNANKIVDNKKFVAAKYCLIAVS